MKTNDMLALVLFLFIAVQPGTSNGDIITDGFSPATAAYSAKQILDNAPGSSDGTYWLDEQMGQGSPFLSYSDMLTLGGGWTLGVVSLDSSPVSSFGITSNTGTVSSPFASSHTRDIGYLGESQDATFHYLVQKNGATIFDGTYFGRFGDAIPVFATSVDTLGLNGQISSVFDFHRPDRNYDVSVLVRESSTPAPRMSAVPEPSSFLLLSMVGLPIMVARLKRNSSPGTFRV